MDISLRVISMNGERLIKHYESLHDGNLTKVGLQPKFCPAGIVTVGWGHALAYPQGGWIKTMVDAAKYYPQYMDMTIEEADALFNKDIIPFQNAINEIDRERNKPLPIPIFFSQSQFDSLVSFSFNNGIGALKTSTLLKRIKAGEPDYMITDAFLMYNKAKVKGVYQSMQGLINRRKTEAMLYNKGILVFYN